MKTYKDVPVKPLRQSVIDEVICDRCGKNGKCLNENVLPGWRGGGPWGAAAGLIQGGERYDADLCHDCTLDLEKWINSGKGEGVERTVG